MAAHVKPLVGESMMARESRTRSDDTLGEIGECLRGLEGRTRRILSHDASVEQRLPWVQGEPLVHLASVLAHESARVVGRRRHHRQHLARTRVDGDDTAYLAFEQSLAQGLQVDIKTQRQVLARDRSLVELTILVVALYSSSCITKHDFHTLLSTEHLLVRLLQSELSDVVARLIVVILLDVALRHLAHITEHVSRIRISIFSDATLLDIEAREAEHLLLEHTEVLVAQLGHEELLGITRITGILGSVLDVVHTLDEKLLGDAQGIAEVHRVETVLLLVHHHHQVVRRLVIYHQLAISVVDSATRRVLYLLEEGITVGIFLIVVAHNLERKETYHIDDDNSYRHTTYHKPTLIKIIIYHSVFFS